jgi:hypothetical protein
MGVDWETEMTLKVVMRRDVQDIIIPDHEELDDLPFSRKTLKWLLYRLPSSPSKEILRPRLEQILEDFFVMQEVNRATARIKAQLKKKVNQNLKKDETGTEDGTAGSTVVGQQGGSINVNLGGSVNETEEHAESDVNKQHDLSNAITGNTNNPPASSPTTYTGNDLILIEKDSDQENHAEQNISSQHNERLIADKIKMKVKKTSQMLWNILFDRKKVILGYSLEKLIPDTLSESKWECCYNAENDYMSEWKLQWDCDDDNDEEWVDIKGKVKGDSLKEFNETRLCLGRMIGSGVEIMETKIRGITSEGGSVEGESNIGSTSSGLDIPTMTPTSSEDLLGNSNYETSHLAVTSSEESLLVTPSETEIDLVTECSTAGIHDEDNFGSAGYMKSDLSSCEDSSSESGFAGLPIRKFIQLV